TAARTGARPGGDAAVLGAGSLLVGAAKTSLAPRPQDMLARFPAARWERNAAACTPLAPEYATRLLADTDTEVDHLASAGSPWPENPDCLYMGGYGLGPMNPIVAFDDTLGLWVRALALGDGKDVTVLTVIDGEGWLWDYKDKCDDCGTKQIAEALAADPELAARGLRPESFNLHATHSHTAMDFLGGWGFVPDWYMAQATDTIKKTVREAVLAMEPAVLETGVVDARQHNSERRGTYRSAEEAQLSWLRAVTPGRHRPRTLATLGAFAAHPVTQDASSGIAHADWPGFFAQRAEDRFGGVGLHIMTGLGNVTGARGEQRDASGAVTRPSTGTALADLLPAVGAGRPVDRTDVRIARTTWRQPITNAPLDALGTPGFFDRQFDAVPSSVRVGKNVHAPCVSAAPQSVELPATVIKIGDDIVITTGPGETFSNLSNTLREKATGQVVFPLGQTNDSLGYLPQSFELSPVGQQGLGFAAGGVVFVNYEDSYAIDRCVGDMVLETTLALMAELE
ncbi:MAG: primase, partial [Frankiales bacterium]|nr:primase [Frankiales bacterium]